MTVKCLTYYVRESEAKTAFSGLLKLTVVFSLSVMPVRTAGTLLASMSADN